MRTLSKQASKQNRVTLRHLAVKPLYTQKATTAHFRMGSGCLFAFTYQ